MYSLLFTAIRDLLIFIEFAIFARVIISWIPVSKDNQFIRLLYQITEPILAPIRGMVERSAFGKNMAFDFSPLIALVLVQIIRRMVPVY